MKHNARKTLAILVGWPLVMVAVVIAYDAITARHPVETFSVTNYNEQVACSETRQGLICDKLTNETAIRPERESL